MISYALKCPGCGHRFDGWFRSAADFDAQAGRGLLACPGCGETKVDKALMTPALAPRRAREAAPVEPPVSASAPEAALEEKRAFAAPGPERGAAPSAEAVAQAFAKFQALSRRVRAEGRNVGPRFAEEARRIHYGETQKEQIYGEASRHEVESLTEEGIVALPLAPLPEDAN